MGAPTRSGSGGGSTGRGLRTRGLLLNVGYGAGWVVWSQQFVIPQNEVETAFAFFFVQ